MLDGSIYLRNMVKPWILICQLVETLLLCWNGEPDPTDLKRPPLREGPKSLLKHRFRQIKGFASVLQCSRQDSTRTWSVERTLCRFTQNKEFGCISCNSVVVQKVSQCLQRYFSFILKTSPLPMGFPPWLGRISKSPRGIIAATFLLITAKIDRFSLITANLHNSIAANCKNT